MEGELVLRGAGDAVAHGLGFSRYAEAGLVRMAVSPGAPVRGPEKWDGWARTRRAREARKTVNENARAHFFTDYSFAGGRSNDLLILSTAREANLTVM